MITSKFYGVGQECSAIFFNKILCSVCVRKDRKSTRLNSSHVRISYAVFCLKKKNKLKLSKIIPTHHTNLTLTPHQLLSPSHHNLTTLHTHFSYAIHLPLVTTDSVPYQPYDY